MQGAGPACGLTATRLDLCGWGALWPALIKGTARGSAGLGWLSRGPLHDYTIALLLRLLGHSNAECRGKAAVSTHQNKQPESRPAPRGHRLMAPPQPGRKEFSHCHLALSIYSGCLSPSAASLDPSQPGPDLAVP